MVRLGRASELASEVTIYHKLVNIRVENSMKGKAMEVPYFAAIIEEKLEAEMAGNGRILVRPSGTNLFFVLWRS